MVEDGIADDIVNNVSFQNINSGVASSQTVEDEDDDKISTDDFCGFESAEEFSSSSDSDTTPRIQILLLEFLQEPTKVFLPRSSDTRFTLKMIR